MTTATGFKISTAADVPSRIQSAFEAASEHSGTSFDYLVRTAKRESNFDPSARAPTSSAAGLFQFIESTWLSTFKEVGPSIGLSKYADQINVTADGKPRVSDASMRSEILNMRFDPDVAAIMAGAHTAKNADYLQSRLGREVDGGELYIAHFLGANGAGRLIETVQSSPEANAVSLFPQQARANKSIFYSGGQPRTVSQVYATLTSKHRDIDASFDFAKAQTDPAGSGRQHTMIAWPGVASNAAQVSTSSALPSRLIASPQNMAFLMNETSVLDAAFQIAEQGRPVDKNAENTAENIPDQRAGQEVPPGNDQEVEQDGDLDIGKVAMAMPRARPLDLGLPVSQAAAREPTEPAGPADAAEAVAVARVFESGINETGIKETGIDATAIDETGIDALSDQNQAIPSRIATSWQAAEGLTGRANNAFAALFANEPAGSVGDGPNPFLVSNYSGSQGATSLGRLPSRLVSNYESTGNAGELGRTAITPAAAGAPAGALVEPMTERLTGESSDQPQEDSNSQSAPIAPPRPLASYLTDTFETLAPTDLIMSPEEVAELRNRGELDALQGQASLSERQDRITRSSSDTASPASPIPRSKPLDLRGSAPEEAAPQSLSDAASHAPLTDSVAETSQKLQKPAGPLDLTQLVDYAKAALPFRVTLRR